MVKLFAVGLLIVMEFGRVYPDQVPILLKLLGLMQVFGLLCFLSQGRTMPIEVKLFFSWVLWAVLTAVVFAIDPYLSLRHGWTIFQMGILFASLVVAHIWSSDLRYIFWGFLVLGLGMALYSVVNPELLDLIKEGSQRLQVFDRNPNGVAELWVISILASLYLSDRSRHLFVKILILITIIPISMLILFTGSRKMLISTLLVIIVWMLLKFRNPSSIGLRHLLRTIPVILVVFAAAYAAVSIWEKTPMSWRWEALNDTGSPEGYFGGRDTRYLTGIEVFFKSPIIGIGLANQELVMGFGCVHSDYIDVLATTGVVGAILYFSVYIIAARRGNKLFVNEVTHVDWRAFQTFVILLAWMMVGFQRYDDRFTLILLGSFIGHFAALGNLKRRKPTRSMIRHI